MPNGGDVTCTITNTAQQPHLTLVKTVTNDNGGTAVPTDWTLTANGPTTGVSGPVGDAAVTNAPVHVGDYTLSETAARRLRRRRLDLRRRRTRPVPTVTVALGDDVTCTINNNDQQPPR